MSERIINKKYLILILGILSAIGPFSVDMYLPGFQQIAIDYHVQESQIAFTLTSYFIGISIGQLIYGPLIDKYGRKKPLIAGLMLYSVAALACALAPNLPSLITWRLFQALGGAVGMVTANAIITDVFEVNERARAFSSMMLVMGVAPLIAPSIGSYFVEHLSWRYTFYFLFIFSLIVSLLIFITLPETSQYIHNKKLKIRVIAQEFIAVSQNWTFLSYTLAGSISMSILYVYISSASFVFMTIYGLDKQTFSLMFALNAAGFISGSFINGVFTKYFNYIKIARSISLILVAISTLVLMIISVHELLPLPWFAACTITVLFITGFINPNTTAASLTPFSHQMGVASALGGAFRMGIGAIMAASIGVFQGETAITLFFIVWLLSILASSFIFLAPKLYLKES